MQNLLKWIKTLFIRRNDFKDDFISCIHYDAWGFSATWTVNDLSDTRKKKFCHAWWRTEDLDHFAEETYVWAVDEADVKRVLMKKFKIDESRGFELVGLRWIENKS